MKRLFLFPLVLASCQPSYAETVCWTETVAGPVIQTSPPARAAAARPHRRAKPAAKPVGRTHNRAKRIKSRAVAPPAVVVKRGPPTTREVCSTTPPVETFIPGSDLPRARVPLLVNQTAPIPTNMNLMPVAVAVPVVASTWPWWADSPIAALTPFPSGNNGGLPPPPVDVGLPGGNIHPGLVMPPVTPPIVTPPSQVPLPGTLLLVALGAALVIPTRRKV